MLNFVVTVRLPAGVDVNDRTPLNGRAFPVFHSPASAMETATSERDVVSAGKGEQRSDCERRSWGAAAVLRDSQ
jgi:hypothetical protein